VRALLALCGLVGCASSEDYRIEQASMAQQARACQADRGTACVYVGNWLTRQLRYDEARAVYLRACERGESAACVRASERTGDEALLVRACKLAVEPCVDAVMSPAITAVDRDQAITQICTKLPSRCTEVFERLLRRGVDVAAHAKASCTPPGLAPRACGELGLLTWPDPAVGLELLGAACSNGDARACWQQSRRTRDDAVARASARRACDLGDPSACDPDAANQILEGLRARCREHDALSCEKLGRLLSSP
jgi:TPR repeat protein